MLVALVGPIVLAVAGCTLHAEIPLGEDESLGPKGKVGGPTPSLLRAGVVGQEPIRHRDSVDAGDADNYEVTFRGARGGVVVIGDGHTEPDLHVYDESGIEVARAVGPGSNCALSFVPQWTGRFRIRVVNNGSVYSDYLLMTN
jgi:hypothetical protein